eukprot:381767-Pyramimonas_sp.AAC.2
MMAEASSTRPAQHTARGTPNKAWKVLHRMPSQDGSGIRYGDMPSRAGVGTPISLIGERNKAPSLWNTSEWQSCE